MSKVIVVDDKDRIISHKERSTLKDSDIYRVSVLWLTNSKGEILLAQRSFKKINNPGVWGPTVAGTNEQGETYFSNIIKEIEEEIGLIDLDLTSNERIFVQEANSKRRYFAQFFKAMIDKPASDFVIQEDEVERVEWFSKREIISRLQAHPEKFIDGFSKIFQTA